MPVISRKGDKNSAGAPLLRGAGTVYACGEPVALHSSPVASHRRTSSHKRSKTTSASPTVYADGSPVVREGSSTSCGHPIVAAGGVNVYVP